MQRSRLGAIALGTSALLGAAEHAQALAQRLGRRIGNLSMTAADRQGVAALYGA